MAIVSIQSSVCYGHVGNAAAVFALRRLGHDVWPIDTVHFSNHPGHGRYRGRVASVSELNELVRGLEEVAALREADAVLSGYLATDRQGEVVTEVVRLAQQANPRALFCCDPVVGDRDSGIYVSQDLVGFFRRRALPLADIITPNHFELELLSTLR